MEKLSQLLESVKVKAYTVSNDKIKQTERNELKSDLLDAISEDLGTAMQVMGRSKKGIIVGIPNDDEGVIYAVVDIVLKNLDYEPEIDLDEYETAVNEKAEKERKLAQKRASK